MPKSGSTPLKGIPGRMHKPASKKNLRGRKQHSPAKPKDVTGSKQIEK